MITTLEIQTKRQGLCDITVQVCEVVKRSNVTSGLCVVFVQHTSASLIIQENADPSARKDMEYWLNKLAPENDPGFSHTAEGPDDMPSHLKSLLTNTSLSIPVLNKQLALGTWQGIYLWEHRKDPHRRNLLVQVLKDEN